MPRLSKAAWERYAEAEEEEEAVGGDPACWLHLVDDEVHDEEPAADG